MCRIILGCRKQTANVKYNKSEIEEKGPILLVWGYFNNT